MNTPCDRDDEFSRLFRAQLDERMREIEWPIMTLAAYQAAIERGDRVAVIDVRKALDCCYIGPQHKAADLYHVPLKAFALGICDVPVDEYDTLVCICVGGPMSAVAACMLRMLGYHNAWFLAGGIRGLVAISDLDDPGPL